MDAIQRQRQRALSAGALASNPQQLVQQSTEADQTAHRDPARATRSGLRPGLRSGRDLGRAGLSSLAALLVPAEARGRRHRGGLCRVLLRRRGRAELPSLGRLEWMGVGRGVASTHRRGEQHLLRPQQLPLAEQLHPQRTEPVVARSTPPRWRGVSLAWRGGPRRCPRGTHSPAGASARGRGHGHHAAVSRRASIGAAAHPFRPGVPGPSAPRPPLTPQAPTRPGPYVVRRFERQRRSRPHRERPRSREPGQSSAATRGALRRAARRPLRRAAPRRLRKAAPRPLHKAVLRRAGPRLADDGGALGS